MSKPRRGPRRHLDGWLVLDKPPNMTSTQAVSKVKYLLKPEKIGHAGTLDPLATGLLPLALGDATKTVPYVVDGQKIYEFTVQWGEERDTDDSEGQVTQRSDSRPGHDEIKALLPRFHGDILQTPPQFSAIKIAGERAYDMARAGETVVLDARPVHIKSLTIIDGGTADSASFHCVCGKGTYVRSIARDLGRLLGCYGHVIRLRRTGVGVFTLANAVTLDAISPSQEPLDELQARDLLLPIATVLDDIPALAVTERDVVRLRNGQPVFLRGRNAPLGQGPAHAVCNGVLVALGQLDGGAFNPTRIFKAKGKAVAVPQCERINDVDYSRAQASAP